MPPAYLPPENSSVSAASTKAIMFALVESLTSGTFGRSTPSESNAEAISMLPLYVKGEPFFVEHEDGVYYIRHDKWSLIGCGETLLDAELDLHNEAADLRDVLESDAPLPLDAESRRMLMFLRKP